jgi:hypothetical protein
VRPCDPGGKSRTMLGGELSSGTQGKTRRHSQNSDRMLRACNTIDRFPTWYESRPRCSNGVLVIVYELPSFPGTGTRLVGTCYRTLNLPPWIVASLAISTLHS